MGRRTRRNLISIIVLICIVAACAAYSYFVFGKSGSPANASSPIPGTTNVLFSDPLTSDVKGWSSDSSHCFFQDNAYHVKNNIACFAPADSISDGNISVQAKQVAGSLLKPYGIAFRASIPNNSWYEFDIDSNGNWDFVKVVNRNSEVDLIRSTPNAAIKSGLNTANTLLVQAKGSHFVFFVNGTKVGEADDSTYSNGDTGLAALGADTEVAYNNFEIMKVS